MKYRKLTGVILKKQNYRESDQIVTVWTEQAGKIRCLGRALRSSKSKLAYSMQPLSLVEIEVAEKHDLPTLISAKNLRLFPNLRENLTKTGLGFFVEELMLKMTPDEQRNIEAYRLLVGFLEFVEAAEEEGNLRQVLDCFILRLLSALGYSIEHAAGSFRIPDKIGETAKELNRMDFPQAAGQPLPADLAELVHKTVVKFAEYILERNIKSNTFLTQI